MTSVARNAVSPKNDTPTPSQAGWRDIASAPHIEEAEILASTTGKIWFQCSYDEEDRQWVTFNRYYENDRHPALKPPPPRVFKPKWWVPLPPAESGLSGSSGNTATDGQLRDANSDAPA